MKVKFLLFLFPILFFACNNSLNIMADWEEKTIVYALLDSKDSISYIKATKAFYGENMGETALIRDSSEYDNLSVTLEKYLNGSLVKTYNFEETIVNDKDNGVFYNPYQKVYSSVTKNELDAIYTFTQPDTTYTYKVKILNNSGIEVSAEIPLISEYMMLKKPRISTSPHSPSVIIFSQNSVHPTRFEWDTVPNAHFYKVDAYLALTELWENGEEVDRDVVWRNFITLKQEDCKVDGVFRIELAGSNFFSFVLQEVPHRDINKEDQIVKRRVKNITIKFDISSKELYNYMSNISSSEGYLISSNYTNIKNGFGLVAARTSHEFVYIVSGETLNVMYFDPDFLHLKFGQF